MTNYEIWSTILSAATFIITSMIIIEIVLMRKFKKDEHREIRRIKTVDMLMFWDQNIKKEMRYAEKIVEQFTPEQCKKLYLQEDLEVNEKIKNQLCCICPKQNEGCEACKDDKGNYIIKDLLLSELRWYVTAYVNMFETIMVAWQLGIVNKNIIETQFAHFYNPQSRRTVLQSFREAAGGKKHFPALEEFCKKITCNIIPKSGKKKKL